MAEEKEMNKGRLNKGIPCPSCKTVQDGFAGTSKDPKDTRPPEDGDFSICFDCGGLNKYTKGMTVLKKLTVKELNDIRDTEPATYHELRRAIQKVTLIRETKTGLLLPEENAIKSLN